MSSEKQHTVPKAYLREFTRDNKGFFFEADIKTEKTRNAHVNNVCYQSDFYNMPSPLLQRYDLSQADYLERNAFLYESKMPDVYRVNRQRSAYIDRSHFQILVDAYISQKQRTFSYRKELEQNEPLRAESLDNVLNKFKTEIESHPILNKLAFDFNKYSEDFRTRMLNDKDQPRSIQLAGIYESSKGRSDTVSEIHLRLMNMNFQIIEAPDGHYFVTSDNPGFSLETRTDGRYNIWNMAFMKVDNIIYPVNSKQAIRFFGINRVNFLEVLKGISYKTATHALMSRINTSTAIVADEKIYCEDEAYLRGVIKYFKRAL
jgi:hypothetical protein